MAIDLPLADLDIPQSVREKLAALAIGGVRQFHARLRRDQPGFRRYLQLSQAAFAVLSHQVEEVIRENFPDDLEREPHPPVNRTGVAVHRLKKRPRPRGLTDGE
jgi:hypothetical protein